MAEQRRVLLEVACLPGSPFTSDVRTLGTNWEPQAPFTLVSVIQRDVFQIDGAFVCCVPNRCGSSGCSVQLKPPDTD